MYQPRYDEGTRAKAKEGKRTLVTIDIDRRFVPPSGKRGGRMTLQAHVDPEMERKLADIFYEILER